jgi:hypothetical protein
MSCKIAKELEAHIAEAHHPQPKDDEFPRPSLKDERPGSGSSQCHLCPKEFTKSSNLNAHTRVHSGERHFACSRPECNKSFHRQYDRHVHEQTHYGAKAFVCEGYLYSGSRYGCGRGFYNAAALRRHHKTEAGLLCLKPLARSRSCRTGKRGFLARTSTGIDVIRIQSLADRGYGCGRHFRLIHDSSRLGFRGYGRMNQRRIVDRAVSVHCNNVDIFSVIVGALRVAASSLRMAHGIIFGCYSKRSMTLNHVYVLKYGTRPLREQFKHRLSVVENLETAIS